MSNLSVCRTCLSFSTRMYDFRNTQLQEIFEKLTTVKLKKDSRAALCYICYAQLRRCLQFSEMTWKAQVVLTELASKGIEITHETISRLNRRTSTFSVTPIDYYYNGSRDETIEPTSTENEVLVKVEKVELEEVEDQTLTDDTFEELVFKTEPVYIEEQIKEELEQIWFEEDIDIESEVTLNENCDVKSEVYVYKHEEYIDIESLNTDTNENFEEPINDKELPNNIALANITNNQLPLNCNICSKVCTTIRKLKNHMKTHTKGNQFTCNDCGKIFNKKRNIRKHMKTHPNKSYTCLLCNKKFLKESYLREHIKIHTKEKPYICDKCGKAFTDRSTFNRHFNLHIRVKGVGAICDICRKTFTRKNYLQEHMRIHTGQRPFACGVCKKSFAQKCALKGHMRIHTGEKTHYCAVCDKGFYRKGHLIQHMVVHSANTDRYSRKRILIRRNEKIFTSKCDSYKKPSQSM